MYVLRAVWGPFPLRQSLRDLLEPPHIPPRRQRLGHQPAALPRRRPLPCRAAGGKVGTYSASDAPEMRKNPELYGTIGGAADQAASGGPAGSSSAAAAGSAPLAAYAIIPTPGAGVLAAHRPGVIPPAGRWAPRCTRPL